MQNTRYLRDIIYPHSFQQYISVVSLFTRHERYNIDIDGDLFFPIKQEGDGSQQKKNIAPGELPAIEQQQVDKVKKNRVVIT